MLIMATVLILIILFLLKKTQRKEFERSVYWNENKTKTENKNTTNECRYYQTLLELNQQILS